MARMNRSQAALVASFVISVGLFLAALGGMSHLNVKFTGVMRVRQGQKECLVVRQSASRSSSPQQESDSAPAAASEFATLSGDAIPFQDPETARNWIDPDADYEVVQLPFFVRLDGIEVLSQPTPRDRIDVSGPDGEESHKAAPGETFALPGATMRVKEIRKWTGLLRDESGRPMASIALRQGDSPWSEQLFLMPGAWLRAGNNVGIVWQWVESEEAARKAVSAGIPKAGAPRWGVLDGSAVNWFVSFDPGTGLELSDGTTVTLLEFLEERTQEESTGPAILVEIVRNGKSEQQWLAANDYDDKSLIRFDYPLKRKTVFALFGWQDGQALAAVYRHGKPGGTSLLAQGDPWQPEEIEWALRLEDVVSSAVSVKSDDSPFFEAVAEIDGKELRLRQAEAVRWGDYLFRFVRDAPPPAVRCALSLVGEEDAVIDSFSLAPGQSVDRQGWRFTQGVSDPRAPDSAVLTVSLSPSRRLSRTGGIVALVGLAGLCLSRLLPKRAGP